MAPCQQNRINIPWTEALTIWLSKFNRGNAMCVKLNWFCRLTSWFNLDNTYYMWSTSGRHLPYHTLAGRNLKSDTLKPLQCCCFVVQDHNTDKQTCSTKSLPLKSATVRGSRVRPHTNLKNRLLSTLLNSSITSQNHLIRGALASTPLYVATYKNKHEHVGSNSGASNHINRNWVNHTP